MSSSPRPLRPSAVCPDPVHSRALPPVVSSRQARALGIPRSRWRRPGRVPSFDLHCLNDDPPEPLDLLRCLQKDFPDVVANSVTAAVLHDFRLPAFLRQSRTMHVNRHPDQGKFCRADVVTTRRRYDSEDLTTVAGVRVTTPLQTLFELVPLLSPGAFVEAADGVLNTHEVGYDAGRPPQATVAEVAEFVRRHRGRRHVRRFAQGMERARPGSDSAPETRLRLLLDDHGVLQFQADLADESRRISIQYEGRHHDASGQTARDVRRARRTEDLGWVEVRITKEDLNAQQWVDGTLLPVPVILFRRAVERRRAMEQPLRPVPAARPRSTSFARVSAGG